MPPLLLSGIERGLHALLFPRIFCATVFQELWRDGSEHV